MIFFLKSDMAGSVLEPASVIAVRVGSSFPAVAQTPFEMRRLRRKKFNDAPISSASAASYEACEAQCQDRLECVAYTYARKTSTCQQFKETVGYFYDEGFDSGYKVQKPDGAIVASAAGRVPGGGEMADAPAPTAAAPAGRIEPDTDKYFKGDGYAKHEDASWRDCEALCLRDARCQAIEHITRQRVCRLYAEPEPALAAFQRVETPPGPWTIRWRYEPQSWLLGLLATWAAWTAFAAYWYHRSAAIGVTA